MDELEKFRIRYAVPSEDAIISACTAYMAITGSVDPKAMEEAVKRAFSANFYKDTEGWPCPQISVEELLERTKDTGTTFVTEGGSPITYDGKTIHIEHLCSECGTPKCTYQRTKTRGDNE